MNNMNRRYAAIRLTIYLTLAALLMTMGVACGQSGPAPQDPAAVVSAGTSPATSSVETPPAEPTANDTGGESFTFAVCGDNRTMGIESGVMDRIVESARANGAAFIVNTGDISNSGSREELLRYKEYTDSSGIRFYTVPGNHDVGRGGTSKAYEEVIGLTYYSFDYANSHFVMLDNADDKSGIDDDQFEWYVTDLDYNIEDVNTFIFTHIPVADPGLASGHVTGEKGSEGLKSGRAAVEEASRRPNVRGFFFGHIHAYLMYRLDGIDAYVTGGAGAPLVFPEGAGGYYHYLLVRVDGDEVGVEVVRI